MSKFRVGDLVVRNEGWLKFCFWGHDRDVVKIVSTRDEGQTLCFDGIQGEWDADKFDLFNPKEAANDIAPSGLVQSYIPLIQQWGRDRGILDNSTPLGQSRKTVEEVRELVEAASKMQAFMELVDGDIDHRFDSYESELADAIGDIFVTLVMVAGCAKLDINACVAHAYDQIKDRKGYLRPDGVFVKEEQV